MPKFRYVAMDGKGAESEGVIDAESQSQAISAIRGKGATRVSSGLRWLGRGRRRRRRVRTGSSAGCRFRTTGDQEQAPYEQQECEVFHGRLQKRENAGRLEDWKVRRSGEWQSKQSPVWEPGIALTVDTTTTQLATAAGGEAILERV